MRLPLTSTRIEQRAETSESAQASVPATAIIARMLMQTSSFSGPLRRHLHGSTAPTSAASADDDARSAFPFLPDEIEQGARIARREPHAAVRYGPSQSPRFKCSVNGVAAPEEDRMRHRRPFVFARAPHALEARRPIGASGRHEPRTGRGHRPSCKQDAAIGNIHDLRRPMHDDEKVSLRWQTRRRGQAKTCDQARARASHARGRPGTKHIFPPEYEPSAQSCCPPSAAALMKVSSRIASRPHRKLKKA